MAYCPECETSIDVDEDDVEEGQRMDCPECGAELEVVTTNPLELGVISTGDKEDEGEEDNW
jgi:alpha-aminoadipate carrier protein LysW